MTNFQRIPIAVAFGNGIGPEIMAATISILKAACADIDIHEVEIGETVYRRGILSGIEPSTWETIRHCKAFLKAPVTTPQGGGFKSLNVAIRTTLGLYANVRPAVSYAPFVETKHPGMDVVIVRENEEDLYMGIEYPLTQETRCALKMMTSRGCERIVRYAFEYALSHERKKVTCFTKDNILKLTDGLFHSVFDEIGLQYPQIEKEHWIVDIGSAKLADTPDAFDVIVTPNLYGDIISDIAAQIAGSVGLAAAANIGTSGAMFEAIHGSAPRRAGQDVANPSGLLLAAVHMLVYIGQTECAEQIHNAWLKTIEDGVHTYDIYREGKSKKKVGTQEFAQAVIQRLGKYPEHLLPVHYKKSERPKHHDVIAQGALSQLLMGCDIFVAWEKTTEELKTILQEVSSEELPLKVIFNRGVEVWPSHHKETLCSDCYRCRFHSNTPIKYGEVIALLQRADQKGLSVSVVQSLLETP